MDGLITVHKERNKCISVRFLDDNTGRAVSNVWIFYLFVGLIPGDKTQIFITGRVFGSISNDLTSDLLTITGFISHRINSRYIGVYRVRVIF